MGRKQTRRRGKKRIRGGAIWDGWFTAKVAPSEQKPTSNGNFFTRMFSKSEPASEPVVAQIPTPPSETTGGKTRRRKNHKK